MPDETLLHPPRRLRADRHAAGWLAFALVAAMASGSLAWLGGQSARREAWDGLAAQTAATATLNAALLRSELEKQRSLPFVLAQDSDILAALEHPDPATLATLNAKLERLHDGTGADVIYLIDATGIAIAASNWRDATSFVGSDYIFREYFQRGMKTGAAEHFALGTVSNRPGLYISRRIGPDTAPLGVIVVKVEFSAVEATWRDPLRPLYVTDERGIVILTNRPEWRFQADRVLPEDALAQIRDSLQFGAAPLTPLPLRANRTGPAGPDPEAFLLDDDNGRGAALLRVVQPVPSAPWQLNMLVPAEGTLSAAETRRRAMVLLVTLPMLGLGGFLAHRAGRARRLALRQEAARQVLEDRVAARTAELRGEIAERESMETRLAEARETLRQANRLATLGQIAAGVAHEINQPVAAISSYAGNARAFLARGDTAAVDRNLDTVIRLTGRIGGITDELRAFARKNAGPVGRFSVAAAVDGAVMLLRARLDHQGVPLRRSLPGRDIGVTGRQVRLEQVLVNLIQNALDALEGQAGGEIHLDVIAEAGEVRITLRDNGPGITPAIMAALFMPFSTSKPQGLGLGLVICNDILREAGGRMEASSSPGTTTFTAILPEAPILSKAIA
jgi:two-component system C4-dicarboxylate transport sensor histidine kinase DctB